MADESEKNTSEGLVPDGFLGANVTVEESGFGPTYAIAQWVNGDPKQKSVGGIAYTGGIFVASDSLIDEAQLRGAGFEPVTLLTKEGVELKGFGVKNLTVSPIRFRRCWQVNVEGELAQRFGHDEYDAASLLGKARGVCHVLVGIKGIDQPVMLSFRGLTAKAVMGMGKDRGIIPSYGAQICGAAKAVARASKKKIDYPLCAFQMTIGPEVDGNKPKFTTVGEGDNSSQVTHPRWVDAPDGHVTVAMLEKLFVGSARLAEYQDWHAEAGEWVEAFSTENLSARRSRLAASKGNGSSSQLDGGVADNAVSL